MSGAGWMKLTLPAAKSVIQQCTDQLVAVSGIEGGIWHNPGFEARLDAIWKCKMGGDPDDQELKFNNSEAERFLSDFEVAYDTAIISTVGNQA